MAVTNELTPTALPPVLTREARWLVSEGWYRDETELLAEALRRFLETRRPSLREQYLREDVEWGLHGEE